MGSLAPGEKVVATGTFLYAGAHECDVRIVFSPTRYGSGDDADGPEAANDVIADTYYVQYGSTTQRGVYSAGGSCHSSLAEACSAAEVALDNYARVRWHAPA